MSIRGDTPSSSFKFTTDTGTDYSLSVKGEEGGKFSVKMSVGGKDHDVGPITLSTGADFSALSASDAEKVAHAIHTLQKNTLAKLADELKGATPPAQASMGNHSFTSRIGESGTGDAATKVASGTRSSKGALETEASHADAAMTTLLNLSKQYKAGGPPSPLPPVTPGPPPGTKDLEDKIAKLESQLFASSNLNTGLLTKLKSKEGQRDAAIAERDTARSDAAAARKELADVKKEMAATKIQYMARLAGLRETINELRTKLAGSEGENVTLREQLTTATGELAKMRADYSQLESRHGTALAANVALGEENESLKSQLGEVEVQRDMLKEQVGTLSSQLDAAKARSRELTTQLSKAQGDLAIAKGDLGRAESQIKALTRQLDEANAKIRGNETTIDSLQSQLEAALARADTAESRAGQAAQRADGLQSKLSTAEGKINRLETSLGEARERISTLESTLGDATSRISDLNASLSKMTSRAEGADAKVLELSSTLSVKLERIQQLELKLTSTLASAEAGSRDTGQQVDSLKRELGVARDTIAELEGALSKLSGAEGRASDADATISALRAQLDVAKIAIESLTGELTTATLRATTAEARADDADKRVGGLTTELKAARSDIASRDSTIEEMRAEIASLKAENQRLSDDQGELTSRLAEAQRGRSTAEARVEDLGAEQGGLITDLKVKLAAADSRSEKLADDLAIAKEELAGKDRTIAELRQENAGLRSDLESFRSDLAAANTTISQQSSKIRGLEASLVNAEKAKGGLSDELKTVKARLQTTAEENVALRRDLGAATSAISSLQAQLGDADGAIQHQRAVIKELSTELAVLKGALTTSKAQEVRIGDLEQSLVKHQKALSRSEQHIEALTSQLKDKTADIRDLKENLAIADADLEAQGAEIEKLTGLAIDWQSYAHGLEGDLDDAGRQIEYLKAQLSTLHGRGRSIERADISPAAAKPRDDPPVRLGSYADPTASSALHAKLRTTRDAAHLDAETTILAARGIKTNLSTARSHVSMAEQTAGWAGGLRK